MEASVRVHADVVTSVSQDRVIADDAIAKLRLADANRRATGQPWLLLAGNCRADASRAPSVRSERRGVA